VYIASHRVPPAAAAAASATVNSGPQSDNATVQENTIMNTNHGAYIAIQAQLAVSRDADGYPGHRVSRAWRGPTNQRSISDAIVRASIVGTLLTVFRTTMFITVT